jgi:uncharacterized membrane protein YccC
MLPTLAQQAHRAAAHSAALRAEARAQSERVSEAHRRAVATVRSRRVDPGEALRQRILAQMGADRRPHSQATLMQALDVRDKGAIHRAVEHLAQAGALQRSGRAPGRPTMYWLPEE